VKKLLQILKEIDGKGYPNYKRIQGIFKWPHYEVAVNYVQGDPFASPSKICLHIPLKNTGVEKEWLKINTVKYAVKTILHGLYIKA
jgi:predicted ABC-class ATPase